MKCLYPKMTGQNDRQDRSLTGQVHDRAGHCPLTGRYLQPWHSITKDTTGRAQKNTCHSCNLSCVSPFDISNSRRLLHYTFTPTTSHLVEFAYFRFPLKVRVIGSGLYSFSSFLYDYFYAVFHEQIFQLFQKSVHLCFLPFKGVKGLF